MCSQEWAASERELKRAMELNPNYPQAYGWNGMRLTMIGKYDEALVSLERGLAIDPTSNGINFYKGVTLAVSGRRNDAIQQYKRLQEMDPTFPWAHSFLWRVYLWNGNHADAVEERAKAVELEGNPEGAKLLRDSFAKGGWEAFVSESKRQGAVGLVSILTLGAATDADKETAVKQMQEKAERGDFWLFLIRTDPLFDPLRGDQRFQELVKKFDLPK